MIQANEAEASAPIIVVEIGNSTTAVATWYGEQIKTPVATPTGDLKAFGESFQAHADAMPQGRPAAVVIGDVVPEFRNWVAGMIEEALDQEALIIGVRVPLPIDVDVDDVDAVGVDRVCAAAAAYDRIKEACIVVDFGTATTVDLVNDDGVFLGGAIMPGMRLQFEALATSTSQLPEVEAGVPDLPYGRNTTDAIQNGVCRGLAGAARGLVENYATALNRWPQVVGTGGDLEVLSPYCDFLDTLSSNLTLRGIGLAYSRHLKAAGA